MKTQDAVDIPTIPLKSRHTGGRARFTMLGAILVVALIVGVSAVVFAQLSQQHKNAAQPASGSWTSVLQGYTLDSIVAAPDSPAVIYACAFHAQNSTTISNLPASSTEYLLLRSIDFGTHWQNISSKAALGNSCELAVNPTDSNDVFTIGTLIGSNGQAAEVLQHTADGGQTWTTIQPKLNLSGSSTGVQWSIQQLSFVGNALFGIQWVPTAKAPVVHPGVMPRYFARLSRLLTSTDGGQTWSVIDQPVATNNHTAGSYIVDPTNNKTIYELAGTPWFPVQPGVAEPNDVIPAYSVNSNLYKTTDGGTTWHILLSNLPFGTQIKMAQGNPQILYLGGTRGPLPYLPRTTTSSDVSGIHTNFSLRRSSDGGTSWQTVPDISQLTRVEGWYVASNGQVFANTTSGAYIPAGQPTVTKGTAIVSTPGFIPSVTPPTHVVPSILAPTPTDSTSQLTIRLYSPTSNAWSTVTKPPIYGMFIGVTPGNANSTVLWFLGTANEQSVLYRYIA